MLFIYNPWQHTNIPGVSCSLVGGALKDPPGQHKSSHGELQASCANGGITINVPLFKKLRDIIFFWWENHFMSHFEGHFEGAKTFLTP
jgi:hypothetical protein